MNNGHDGRPACEWTSPEPRGPIPGTLEDPDMGSGVHRLVWLSGKKMHDSHARGN